MQGVQIQSLVRELDSKNLHIATKVWCRQIHICIYIYIYIYICFCSFSDSFEFRNSNLSGCVYLLFDLPSWCWAFIYFIPMPQGLWKSSLELSKSLILASNWVSAGFTHFSGLMFAAGFWPLCSCCFPGQWYIYKYMRGTAREGLSLGSCSALCRALGHVPKLPVPPPWRIYYP